MTNPNLHTSLEKSPSIPHVYPMTTQPGSPRNLLLIVAGTASLFVGVVGAFVPVLPTTPFVLLAALCYLRSSQRLYDRLMNSRFATPNVRNVLDGKGIPMTVKVISLGVSAAMIGYVCIAVTDSTIVRGLLGLLFAVQFFFMLRIKTLPSRAEPD